MTVFQIVTNIATDTMPKNIGNSIYNKHGKFLYGNEHKPTTKYLQQLISPITKSSLWSPDEKTLIQVVDWED